MSAAVAYPPGYLAFLLDLVTLVQERQRLAIKGLTTEPRYREIDAALAPFEGSR